MRVSVLFCACALFISQAFAQEALPPPASTVSIPAAITPPKAQRQLVAGRDYYILTKPIPSSPDRLDVIYFFWYGSPFSQEFDPLIRSWADQKAPALVRFQPSPVVLADSWGYGARVFFALEKLNLEQRVGPPLMRAISQGVVSYENPSSMSKWLGESGVNQKAFAEAINSPIVIAKTASSPRVAKMYGVDRVPSVVIDGKFLFVANDQGDVKDLLGRVAFAAEALSQHKAIEMRERAKAAGKK